MAHQGVEADCPQCGRELTGAIETSAAVVGGIQFDADEGNIR